MAIPDFQSILLPLLKYTAAHAEVATADAYGAMERHFALTEAERSTRMASGPTTVFRNRVAWAKQYLLYAGLIEPVRRAVSRVTPEGSKWAKREGGLKLRDFEVIPGFRARARGTADGNSGEARTGEVAAAVPATTPDERMAEAERELRQSVIHLLLQRIVEQPPAFLERLVIRLMAKLNYGDGSAESMLHTGRTGDGGIDGVIKMDVLGLDHIYLQAKRYDRQSVPREDVAAFAGSIAGSKGVFVTTSNFSKPALEFVRATHKNIVLVDGQKLGELMLRAGLGVAEKRTYRVFGIDEDFFAEDDE